MDTWQIFTLIFIAMIIGALIFAAGVNLGWKIARITIKTDYVPLPNTTKPTMAEQKKVQETKEAESYTTDMME